MPTDTAPADNASTQTPAAETKSTGSKGVDLAARLNAMNAKQGSTPADADPKTTPPVTTTRDATKLAQALIKATTSERQALEHKSAAEKHATRVAELEAQLAAWEADRSDVNKLLQRGKVTPEQLAQMFLEKKLNFQPTPDAPAAPELPDDVKREIEYARSKRTQEERETAIKAATEARETDIATVKESLAPLAAQYPLVAALPGAADRLLDAMLIHAEDHDGEVPDFAEMVKNAEAAVAAELKAVASSDAALKSLIDDEAIATKLRSLLGVQPARAKVNPPPMTARNTSGVPNTKKGWDPAAAAARLNSMGK